jgi:hypothetical protein
VLAFLGCRSGVLHAQHEVHAASQPLPIGFKELAMFDFGKLECGCFVTCPQRHKSYVVVPCDKHPKTSFCSLMVAIDEVQRIDPKDNPTYQLIIDHLKTLAEHSNKFRKIRRICDER